MSGERRTVEHLAPWLGLVGAAAGWMISQQVGSSTVFDDCRTGEGWFVIAVSLAGLALAVAGGFYSLDVWRQGRWRRLERDEMNRLLAIVDLPVSARSAR